MFCDCWLVGLFYYCLLLRLLVVGCVLGFRVYVLNGFGFVIVMCYLWFWFVANSVVLLLLGNCLLGLVGCICICCFGVCFFVVFWVCDCVCVGLVFVIWFGYGVALITLDLVKLILGLGLFVIIVLPVRCIWFMYSFFC